MENDKQDKVEWFDSYLNKAIFYASIDYFRKQNIHTNREKTLFDDDNFKKYVERFASNEDAITMLNEIAEKEQIKNALTKLSDIEQAVIFLHFNNNLTGNEASQILSICRTSEIHIRNRALNKLRKILEEELYDEE